MKTYHDKRPQGLIPTPKPATSRNGELASTVASITVSAGALSLILQLALGVTGLAQAQSPGHGQDQLMAPKSSLPIPPTRPEASSVDLITLIRAQQAEIDMLKSRLAALETKTVAPAASPPQSTTALASSDQMSSGQTQPTPNFTIDWEDGAPSFSTRDKSFTFKPRGRIALDIDTTTGSDFAARNQTTTGARGLRLGVEGTVGKHFVYTFESDFVDNQTDIVSAYIGYRDKVGSLNYDIRVGNLFNDRSLEGQTSATQSPFMERNIVANALTPVSGYYGMGAMTRIFGKTWHASIAYTGDDIDGSATTQDSWTLTSRAHLIPIKTQDTVVHLGVWGFNEDLSGSGRTVTRNTIIGGRFNSNLRIQSGALTNADKSHAYGLEAALIHKALMIWAEAGSRDIEFLPGTTIDKVTTDAWTLGAGYFVTGEKAPYSARQGNFSAPKILRSIDNGGPGAWQFVARYENLDLSGSPLVGDGEASTLGVNWYPIEGVRFAINWINWMTQNNAGSFIGEDQGNSLTARAQFQF